MLRSKICPSCKETKPLTSEFFYTHRSRSGGFKAYCKPCEQEKLREWERRNPDKIRAKQARARIARAARADRPPPAPRPKKARPACLECGQPTSRGGYNFCSNKCQHKHGFKIRFDQWQNGGQPWKEGAPLKTALLVRDGHQCRACKRTEWEGVPIPLEMDHISGNSEDNSWNNMRLLCPNCHALTPTHKKRNAGSGREARRLRRQLKLSAPFSQEIAMAYTKLSVDKVLAAQPDINVLDLAIAAVDDHRLQNGCEFESEAPGRAVAQAGLHPEARAADLPHESLIELSNILESMETSCLHKTMPV